MINLCTCMHDMLCEMYTELFFMVSVFVGEKIVHVSERKGINRELNCCNFSDLLHLSHYLFYAPATLFLLRTKLIVCKWVGSMKGNRFCRSVFYILKLILKHLLTSQQYIRLRLMDNKLLKLVSKNGINYTI